MTVLSNLLALLSLDANNYLDGLSGAEGATSSFTDKLSNIGGAVAVAGLTAAVTAVTAVGVAAWNAGNTIDDAMDKIAQKTGATGPVLAGLQKDFEAVFSSIPTDANTAAVVIGQLNSQLKLTGEPLQNLSKQVLEVTRMTGGDALANSEQFARVIGDWSIPVDKASGSLDKLYAVSQATGAPISELMQRVVQYGAPMRGFGFSFEESTALLAKWQAEGVNVETVMAGMRIAAGKFNKDGMDMKTGLWSTVNAIKNAKDSTEALSIAMKVFGAKSAVDMMDTIRGGKFDINQLVESMDGAYGVILKTAGATEDWGEKWKTFQNKITVALAPLGQKLMDAAGKGLDALIAIFERPEVQIALSAFADFAVQTIGTVVAYIPVLVDGFFQFVSWLQNNQGIIIGILAGLGVAVTAWAWTTAAAAVTAMLPFLPVIAVMALVGVAAYLLYQAWTNNWGGIQQQVAAAWAQLQPILSNLWDWLTKNIPVALQTVARFWTNTLLPALMVVWDWLAKNIPVALQALAEFWTKTLLPAIQAVWDWMNSVLFPFLKALFGTWLAGWRVELQIFAGIWSNYLGPALIWIGGILANYVIPAMIAANNVLFPWQKALQGISDAIKGVTGWLDQMTTRLNNIKLPSWLTPGSPTPWEIGLWGIADAMSNLAGQQLPKFSAQLALQPVAGTLGIDAQPRLAASSAAGAVSSSRTVTIGTINLGASNYSKDEIVQLVRQGVDAALNDAVQGEAA